VKTTIEIPDDLFAEAKEMAARRRTTLKAMFERALRRELAGYRQKTASNSAFRIDQDGLPVLIATDATKISSEQIYEFMEDLGI